MAATTDATRTRRVDSHARTTALIAEHGPALLRVARRVSLCVDDAHEAFQRALEIYLRRLDTIDPRTEAAWMRVVVRNEALAVRKSRSQLVASEDVDFDAHVDQDQRSLQERIESAERITRSTEALRALKPDEARALLLKAEGLSYGEISHQLGWTYTKVNRCITEGRARFRKVFGGIESGEQCERFAPLLLALAEGSADADALLTLKPHLRHCLACRADVRRLHGSRWSGMGAWLPLPGLFDRLRPSSLKAELYGLLSRASAADPLTSAMATGGGRSSAATALVGVCLAGFSAGGYCALGGPLPDLPEAGPTREAATVRGASAVEPPIPAAASAPRPARVATAGPAPAAASPAAEDRRQVEDKRAPRASPRPAPAAEEFSFEAAAVPEPTPTSAPADAPAPPEAEAPAPEPAAASEREALSGEFGFER